MDRQQDARRVGIRNRLSYANVMSTIAVFGVLAGGGAYAASKIGASDIAKNAVRSKHITENAVKTPEIADGAVTAPKLADGVEGLQGTPGVDGADGVDGDDGDDGVDGVDGTARAYAHVTSHQTVPCLFTGDTSCVISHA